MLVNIREVKYQEWKSKVNRRKVNSLFTECISIFHETCDPNDSQAVPFLTSTHELAISCQSAHLQWCNFVIHLATFCIHKLPKCLVYNLASLRMSINVQNRAVRIVNSKAKIEAIALMLFYRKCALKLEESHLLTREPAFSNDSKNQPVTKRLSCYSKRN